MKALRLSFTEQRRTAGSSCQERWCGLTARRRERERERERNHREHHRARQVVGMQVVVSFRLERLSSAPPDGVLDRRRRRVTTRAPPSDRDKHLSEFCLQDGGTN